jgi:type VI secretion system protein VasG
MKRIELKLQETYSATLVYGDDFLDFVVKKGDEPTIGGRAIEQVINRSLMPMLAERCIENVGLGESFETVEIKMLEGGGGYELAIS